jgi:hypothetical protein
MSPTKKRQTMGKMTRERELKEKRAQKQEKKDERKQAAEARSLAIANGEPWPEPGETGEAGLAETADDSVSGEPAAPRL